ncbi:MAG: NAD(P)-dependent glycerol-3-phosphate dehydrogenase [Bryobacterales bacterium]|nr:NAD(P)-dependent glycerol-3-phosphate dehydrogenase [Bryobacterales bacterium]
MKSLAIVGGGSWGTALSIVLAPRFPEVRLWVYEKDLAERMAANRVNDIYLPDFRLPGNVLPSSVLGDTVNAADIVLGVMPSHHARSLYAALLPHVSPQTLFVSATKGLETSTHLRMTAVIQEVIGKAFKPRTGALSGPTFAKEVARGEPAAVVIASEDRDLAKTVQTAFSGPVFRLYTNSDPIGVETGAALKNVIAIAAGVCQGLGLGANTLAALITRGLAEITRLAVAAGGQARTLAGLAGLGDLVLTCHGDLSRNRQVGILLGQGKSLPEILSGMRMVAEGVKTTTAAVELASQLGVELPITRQMYRVLCENQSPRESIRELMDRQLKEE